VEIPSKTKRGRQTKSKKTSAPLREGRRDRNKREKLTRIVVAARALFHAKGYDETTTHQVAEAADIGTGTLFLYAKSKEDLLVLVFKDEMSELIEQVYASIPEDAPLLSQVEALFDGFIQYHKRDVAIAQVLIRELTFLGNPKRQPDVVAIPEAIVAKLVHFVAVAQERGTIRTPLPPDLIGRCFFALYYQQLQTWLGNYVGYADFRDNLHSLLDTFADGLLKEAESAAPAIRSQTTKPRTVGSQTARSVKTQAARPKKKEGRAPTAPRKPVRKRAASKSDKREVR